MKIESVHLEVNDDNTVSYRVCFKPKKKKASNGAEQTIYSDCKTGTAKDYLEAIEKVEELSNNEDD